MKALVAYSWPGNVRELENLIERMVVAVQHDVIELPDLPSEVRAQDNVAFRPRRERRRTVADELYTRLTENHESFWTTVYPMYMAREITRANVRDLVRKRARRGSRQLQDRRPPLQHGIARIQTLLEFPDGNMTANCRSKNIADDLACRSAARQ